MLLSFFFASSVAHAFDFNDLKKVAATKSTLEATIAALPREFRENYVLIHKSRSIQAGSPDKPRAVVFNDDASLVVTFTAENRGGDHLEAMTFSQDRFDVKTIGFSTGRAVVNETPQNCFGCHGRMDGDLKPVWDPGLIWRGSYGSHDDTFADPAIADEADAYARFVTGAAPLYRSLDLNHRIGAGDRHQIENRPNLRLGLLLMRQQAKRVARLMGRGALAKLCAPRAATVSSEVARNLTRFLTPLYGEAFANDFLADEAPSLSVTLDAISESGIDVDEIPLTIERRTSAVFDASFPFRDLLMAEVARRENKLGALGASLASSRLGLVKTSALESIDAVGLALPLAQATSVCRDL